MAEKDDPASPADDMCDLGRRNQTIGRPPDVEEESGYSELRDDSRIDRLEQGMLHIESLLEKLFDHQAASATDELRRELARLTGRLDAIESLNASSSPATQGDVARGRPSRTDPGLNRLVQLSYGRRSPSGRGQAIVTGIGALLDLDGTESATGLLSAYQQARTAGPGRNRR